MSVPGGFLPIEGALLLGLVEALSNRLGVWNIQGQGRDTGSMKNTQSYPPCSKELGHYFR